MKHIIDLDALRTTGLPPGASLHRADGIQVNVEETDALVQNGEIVEIRQDGKRIGQLTFAYTSILLQPAPPG